MALNTLLLLLTLTGGGFAVYKNIKNTMNSEDEVVEYQSTYTNEVLIDYIKEFFSKYVNEDYTEKILNQKEYERLEKQRLEFKKMLKDSSYGNVDAKNYIKAFISNILQKNKIVTKENIDKFIKFTNVNDLSSTEMVWILAYAFSKYCDEELSNKTYKDGLTYMIDKYHLIEPHIDDTRAQTGEMVYDISAKMIKKVYLEEQKENGVLTTLDFSDKIGILSAIIFSKFKGFGPVEILLDAYVDEIDCGVSGIPAGSYDVDKSQLSKAVYSYESIWIMLHGLNVHFSALKFDSQAELIRVTQHIYRYEAPNVLSRTVGRVISTMKDGSRVVAVRPPFADSYAFFVRRFSAEVLKTPEELFREEGNEWLHLVMKWAIKGHRNIMYTGSQGTGKTTTMKSYFKYVPIEYNVRIQELTAELNLRYLYPNRNITSFQETADISTQIGLDTQKKTNGAVNIIGEVATAEAACWIIQTAKVASLFTWASHHAKTARDLITAIRDNLLQLNIFSDSIAAEAAVADVLNLDVHMEKDMDKKIRYVERITEIIPIKDHSYPTDGKNDLPLQDKYMEDMREQARRITDRKQFDVQNIIEYRHGKYVVTNMFTDATVKEMRSKIPEHMLEQFDADMAKLKAEYEHNVKTGVAA